MKGLIGALALVLVASTAHAATQTCVCDGLDATQHTCVAYMDITTLRGGDGVRGCDCIKADEYDPAAYRGKVRCPAFCPDFGAAGGSCTATLTGGLGSLNCNAVCTPPAE